VDIGRSRARGRRPPRIAAFNERWQSLAVRTIDGAGRNPRGHHRVWHSHRLGTPRESANIRCGRGPCDWWRITAFAMFDDFGRRVAATSGMLKSPSCTPPFRQGSVVVRHGLVRPNSEARLLRAMAHRDDAVSGSTRSRCRPGYPPRRGLTKDSE